MKKRNAENRFTPAIPVSGHDAYVASILGEPAAKAMRPVPMGEFTAPEFSIQPVIGARAFDVDKLGRLRGVSHPQIWTPGENEASCRVNEDTSYAILINAFTSAYFRAAGGYVTPSTAPIYYSTATGGAASPKPPHGLVGCSCGFYGYYDGSNDYHKPERVSGVVEGYGEVVIGTRGFRATKARIVALTIPGDVPFGTANRVRHNYRDVPFYDSFEAMVSAYPTDVEVGLTPETDPEFWTRSAS